MNRYLQLFIAISFSVIVLGAWNLFAPNSLLLNATAGEWLACSDTLREYSNGRPMPEQGTPEHKRYWRCYVLICGEQPV